MLLLGLGLFVLAAALGLTVAISILRKQETSKPVALAHGACGAAGLIVLLLFTIKNPNQLLTVAIGLLVVAAIGGLVLFTNDIRKKPGPLALIAIHAAAAIVAVSLVAWVAFR